MHTDLDVCVCVCVCHLLFIFLHINAAWTPLLRLRQHCPASALLLSHSTVHPALGAECIFGQFQLATGIFSRCTLSAIYLLLMFAPLTSPAPSPVQSVICRLPFAVCHRIRQLLRLRVRHALWRLWVCGVRNTEKKVSRCKWILTKDTHPPTATLAHTHTHTVIHMQRNAHKYDNPLGCIHMENRVGEANGQGGEWETAIAFGCGPWFVDEQVPIRWDVGRMKCWSGA